MSQRYDHLVTLEGHTDWVYSLAFSPNGQILASASMDESIKLWNPENGHEIRTIKPKWYFGQPGLAFSPDGMLLAHGNNDNTISVREVSTGPERPNPVELWDVASGQRLEALAGLSDAVFAVAFSRDGRFLASGSGDHTIRLWGSGICRTDWQTIQTQRARQMREQKAREELQREWRATGRCEVCGDELGWLDKIAKHRRCNNHR